jgi:hypothetical protein
MRAIPRFDSQTKGRFPCREARHEAVMESIDDIASGLANGSRDLTEETGPVRD